jgi:hypothetical protein
MDYFMEIQLESIWIPWGCAVPFINLSEKVTQYKAVTDVSFPPSKTETSMAQQTDSFNRTVQFWNDSVLVLQVCLLIRILVLSGNATKPININEDETEGLMKTHFYFIWTVQPQRFLHTMNAIPCEFTYLVTMPAKPVSATTREITSFHLTVVTWIRAVCVQVQLHIMACLGSETKYTSNKLLC